MPANRERPRLRILGQILKLYIVAEDDQGLVLVDQHAAAERIRFERLKELYQKRSIRQELAEPIAIELSPSEQIMISSWQETLEDIGFEIITLWRKHLQRQSCSGTRQKAGECRCGA